MRQRVKETRKYKARKRRRTGRNREINREWLRQEEKGTEYMKRQKLTKQVKGKAVPLHAIEAHGGRGGIAPTHTMLGTRWGWVVSVAPLPRFTPGERTSGTHWIEGWVSPRAGLDAGARRKILCPCRGSNLDRPIVQPVVRHYTAWATATPTVSCTVRNKFNELATF
jgi:hypothetical protein